MMELQRTEIDGRACTVGEPIPGVLKIVFDDGEIAFATEAVSKFNPNHDELGRFSDLPFPGMLASDMVSEQAPALRLTDDQAQAIANYTSTGNVALNRLLRHGEKPDYPSETDRLKKNLDELFKSTSLPGDTYVPQDTYVYRGLTANASKEFADAWATQGAGAQLLDKGFISSTLDNDKAIDWSTTVYDPGLSAADMIARVQEGGNVGAKSVVEISLPKGSRALEVGKWSSHPDEEEVLINRNSVIKLDSVSSSPWSNPNAGAAVKVVTYRAHLVPEGEVGQLDLPLSKVISYGANRFVWDAGDLILLPVQKFNPNHDERGRFSEAAAGLQHLGPDLSSSRGNVMVDETQIMQPHYVLPEGWTSHEGNDPPHVFRVFYDQDGERKGIGYGADEATALQDWVDHGNGATVLGDVGGLTPVYSAPDINVGDTLAGMPEVGIGTGNFGIESLAEAGQPPYPKEGEVIPAKPDAPSVHTMTDVEKAVIHSYTGSGNKRLNEYLRKGIAGEGYAESLSGLNGRISTLDGVFSDTRSAAPVTLYRGISPEAAQRWDAALNENQGTFVDKGFVSTSDRESFAQGWKSHSYVTIAVPAGVPLLPITKWSSHKQEGEVLIARDQTFKIDRKEPHLSGTHYFAHLIPKYSGGAVDAGQLSLPLGKALSSADKFTWGEGDVIFVHSNVRKFNPNHDELGRFSSSGMQHLGPRLGGTGEPATTAKPLHALPPGWTAEISADADKKHFGFYDENHVYHGYGYGNDMQAALEDWAENGGGFNYELPLLNPVGTSLASLPEAAIGTGNFGIEPLAEAGQPPYPTETATGSAHVLTDAQKQEIAYYTEAGNKAVNRLLRYGTTPDFPEVTNNNIATLDSIFADTRTAYETTVYRGISHNMVEVINDALAKNQGMFVDKGFVSTTDKEGLAEKWKGVYVTMRLPAGSPALNVRQWSSHSEEQETLIARGQTFVVSRDPLKSNHFFASLVPQGSGVDPSQLSLPLGKATGGANDKFIWDEGDVIFVHQNMVAKYNEHHDELGRFAEGDGARVPGESANWVRPEDKSIRQEYQVEYKHHLIHETGDIFPTEDSFLQAVKDSPVVTVDRALDSKISGRSQISSMSGLLSLISGYRSFPQYRNAGTLAALEDRIKTGKPVDMPIVTTGNGHMRVLSGNTRMDIGFMHADSVKVVMLDLGKYSKFNPNHDDKGRFTEAELASRASAHARAAAMYRDANLPHAGEPPKMDWPEENGKVIAYHGTAQAALDNIFKEGITVQNKHNFGQYFYQGDRGQSIFVSEYKDEADRFAGTASGFNPVTLELRIPKDVWPKFKQDEALGEGSAYAPIKIPPEWITRVSGNGWSKSASLFRKDGYMTVYMVILVSEPGEPDVSKFNLHHDQLGRFATADDRPGAGLENPLSLSSVMSHDEQEAVQYYVTEGSYIINGHLRGRLPGKPYVSDTVKLLESAVNSRKAANDLTVYRGFHDDRLALQFDKQLAGRGSKEFVDKGFVSTSSNEQVAGRFTGGEHYDFSTLPGRMVPDIGYMMQISVPKGTPALDAGALGLGSPTEHEVILQHGTRFKLDRKVFDGHTNYYYAHVVPQ